MKKRYLFGGFGIGKQTINIEDSYLTISRQGALQALNHGFKGEKTINIKNITAVQIKKPGMTRGYIQFVLMGSSESKGGVIQAAQDENTILFQKYKQLQQALEIKKYIEKINSESDQLLSNQISVSDELRKLKSLLDDGILTTEEFNNQKEKLLS